MGKGIHYGLDFTGGTLLEFAFQKEVTSDEVRSILTNIDPKFSNTHIQTEQKKLEQGTYKAGAEPKTFMIVRTEFLTQETAGKIQSALQNKFGNTELLKNESIGPTVGNELKRGAIIAIIVALVIQLFYITFRFGTNIRYGIAADIALVHDVIIMVGFYSLTGREIDSPFVAALLTVIGYSVMDSIVIFDRIRENMIKIQRVTFPQLVNTSVLQTMTRSVNTLLTVLFTLFALYFFGGETLKNFAFALLIGVTSGAYSSIFVASPTLVIWDEWRKKQTTLHHESSNGKAKVSSNGKGHLEEGDNELPGIIQKGPHAHHTVTQDQARRAIKEAGSKKPRRERKKHN